MTSTPPADSWDPSDAREALRAVLNSLPALLGYWDRSLRNRLANQAYVEFFGMTPEEIDGRHIRDVLGEALFAQNLPFMKRALAGEEQLFDREIRTPSGAIRYTQASYIPDTVGGETRGFFVQVTDITARREAEIALHASEERYRTLVEHLPRSAVTLVGPDRRVRWFGGSIVEEAGLDPAALIGRPVCDAAGGGAHGRAIDALYARALAGEAVSEAIFSQLTGRDFRLDIAALRRPDGSVEAALGVAQDITERLAAQAEVRLQSAITANMAEGAVLMRASDLVIVHANPTAERLLGYEPGELTGRHISVLNAPLPDRTPEATAEEVTRPVIAGAGVWAGEILTVRRDGSTFWRRSTISRFQHATEGELLICVLDDVTAQRQQEAEQTALASIATLVAEGQGPAAVFAAVAEQIRELFDADVADVTRFDATAEQGEVLARRTAAGTPSDPGGAALTAGSAASAVARTGRPARQVDRDGPAQAPGPGPVATGDIAAPIVVAGTLWGAVSVLFSGRPVPPGAEERLARFARLVAVAIANADAWDTLAQRASTDALTGLANHRTFQQQLAAESERARRSGRDLALVLLDLDHFKRVNDAYGHPVGDRVLAETARRLSAVAREGELLARIGGEEFAWLLPDTDQTGAFAAAERARRAIEGRPFDVVGRLTVSVGICASAGGIDPEQLVRSADQALYWAKDGGRNTTFVYSDDAREVLRVPGRTTERVQALSGVRALARAIDSKDASTRRHSDRVADLAERLALQEGWTAKRARLLHACGLLHDVGKIGLPDSILLKQGPLTAAEYEQVKGHAATSASIAAEVLEAEQAAWIRAHHERWDGGGYPDGIAGPAIPDGAQLLAVADAWDVMTRSRVYQAPKSFQEAVAECRRGRGSQFAPAAVDALMKLVDSGALAATATGSAAGG